MRKLAAAALHQSLAASESGSLWVRFETHLQRGSFVMRKCAAAACGLALLAMLHGQSISPGRRIGYGLYPSMGEGGPQDLHARSFPRRQWYRRDQARGRARGHSCMDRIHGLGIRRTVGPLYKCRQQEDGLLARRRRLDLPCAGAALPTVLDEQPAAATWRPPCRSHTWWRSFFELRRRASSPWRMHRTTSSRHPRTWS